MFLFKKERAFYMYTLHVCDAKNNFNTAYGWPTVMRDLFSKQQTPCDGVKYGRSEKYALCYIKGDTVFLLLYLLKGCAPSAGFSNQNNSPALTLINSDSLLWMTMLQ